ncbi:MAG: ATP-dependent Clp protease ATP-binding subunit, partial [Acutalibacter sp.]|nr:ATP-dependent Clp protease ATP-binding subunit [Acutalibacter sp.]
MMMLCTRCHKRPATVFVSQSATGKDIKGYCFVCAKELGIKPVNDIMDNMMNTLKQQTGMTEEEFQEATEQMTQMMRLDAQESGEDDDEDEEEGFSLGGAATLPTDMMLGGAPGANAGQNVRDRRESIHKKKRKHIQNY